MSIDLGSQLLGDFLQPLLGLGQEIPIGAPLGSNRIRWHRRFAVEDLFQFRQGKRDVGVVIFPLFDILYVS